MEGEKEQKTMRYANQISNASTALRYAFAFALKNMESGVHQTRFKQCPTTVGNTGRIKGACVLLEQLMEKKLLYLPCRYHILEVVLRSVFDAVMGRLQALNRIFSKNLKLNGTTLIKKFKSEVKDKSVANKLINPGQISSYLLEQLTVHHSRSDYKKLINLCLIFLERFQSENIVFAAPGAFHHARWMAKAIYSLKINLFREQFQLTIFEKQGFHDICLFIINIYVKVWLDAPKPALAPNQDLQLLKSLVNYNKVNKFISDISVSKFINHI
ncbi:hypothetical protein HELRODRAFT_167432 [Helobdella robusta]|uniref:Uncharacterized protein n=1 Tax=Helobdella robusta TaxID=6412 RepID=T1EZD0_HELRO|nr:hypothetical protein HELRODRAFT_167432 [Helobdella robusta]ESO10916.1 hypothetical protein HELRODRAFT_167432 [Helobdella robusta]